MSISVMDKNGRVFTLHATQFPKPGDHDTGGAKSADDWLLDTLAMLPAGSFLRGPWKGGVKGVQSK